MESLHVSHSRDPDSYSQLIVKWLLIGFILCEIGLVIAGATKPWYTAGVILTSLFIVYSVRNVFFGLCSLILLHPLVIRTSEDIDPGEIAFGIYLFLILAAWLYHKKLVRGERILEDTMDYSLAIFFGFCLFSLAPALLFGNSILKWFRELVPFLGYLLYYPMKDTLRNSRQIKILSLCFMLLVVFIGVVNIIQYSQLLGKASYLWEIQASRQTANEPLFLVLFGVSVVSYLYAKNLKIKLLSLMTVVFSAFVLVLSFSRGYWIAACISLFLIFIYVDLKRKLQMLSYIPVVVLPAIVIASLYLGGFKEFFYQVVLERVASIANWEQDISLVGRFNEAKTLFSLCLINPIVGYGLGATYTFYNIVLGFSINTWYTHNAFLFLLFKTGIFGLLSFLSFYLIVIKRGYLSFKKTINNWYQKSLSLGIVCSLISMIPLSITSPQFIQNDSILIIALGAAFVTVIHRNIENHAR